MRKVYLIRHAKPETGGRRMCIGTADLPVGILGQLQSVILSEYMQERKTAQVFCSDLQRSIQTAEYLNPNPIIIPGLREMHAGDWDGLDFEEIQKRWPELYKKRGSDPNIPIPGAEDVEEGQRRFLRAVHSALEQSTGDIAIVTHITVIQSLICHVLGIPPTQCRQFRLDYCSVTQLYYDGQIHVADINGRPHVSLDEAMCLSLLHAAQLPDRVIRHCEAVRRKALEIANELRQSGAVLDLEIIASAALLHDIARIQKEHAVAGADWLAALGYPEVSEVIRSHHDFDGNAINEQAVVYLADKVIRETDEVTIPERFRESSKKCLDDAARAAHEKRFQTAIRLRDAVNARCEKEVVL